MWLLQMCLLSCFKKKPLLNSAKLALLLILWSFLSVLIEVQPLAWAGGRRRRLAGVCQANTHISTNH